MKSHQYHDSGKAAEISTSTCTEASHFSNPTGLGLQSKPSPSIWRAAHSALRACSLTSSTRTTREAKIEPDHSILKYLSKLDFVWTTVQQ